MAPSLLKTGSPRFDVDNRDPSKTVVDRTLNTILFEVLETRFRVALSYGDSREITHMSTDLVTITK